MAPSISFREVDLVLLRPLLVRDSQETRGNHGEIQGNEDPSRTRQSPLTLATSRSWGIHWMTPHEGPGESVPDNGPAAAP